MPIMPGYETDPKIYCGGGSQAFSDQFFIHAKVPGVDNASRYLHPDGVWRTTTFHEGKSTGHYQTKEEAQAVLDRFMETLRILA